MEEMMFQWDTCLSEEIIILYARCKFHHDHHSKPSIRLGRDKGRPPLNTCHFLSKGKIQPSLFKDCHLVQIFKK